MFYAVKINDRNEVVETLNEVFTIHRECFMAARRAYGVYGRLMFAASRLLMR